MPELILDTQRVLHIDSRSLIGVRVGVFGSSGSGKSNTVARLVEQVSPYMSGGTFFDFHDEAYGLQAKLPMLRVGKNPPFRKDARKRSPLVQIDLNPATAADFAEHAYMKNLAVIVNLAYMHEDERQELVLNYCERLWELAMGYAKPYWVVLEEAHNFIPQRTVTQELDMIRRFAAEGRKFGITPILASQRTSKVNKDVVAECDYLFLHRVNIEHDRRAYRGLLPTEINRQNDLFITMQAGEAVVKWWENGNARFDRVQICKRDTLHVGATPDGQEIPLPTLQTVDVRELGLFEDKKPQPTPPAVPNSYSVADKTEIRRYQRVNALQTLTIALLASRLHPLAAAPKMTMPAPVVPSLPLMTDAGISKQQRAFNALLKDVVNGCEYPFHLKILKYFLERKDAVMSVKDIARFVGLAESTVRDHPPLYLCKSPLLLLQRGRMGTDFHYWLIARETLTERFPDLPTDELISKLLEVRS